MEQAALVLEGGSLRCLFTAGVLDVFMEGELEFPYVIGVSAGAMSGLNYISHQPRRTARINIDYVNDSRYLGMKSLLKTHSIFNFDFLFGELSEELIPFDGNTFGESEKQFVAVSTDCAAGTPLYHKKGESEDILLAARASSSMPLLAPMVRVDGAECLDGGITNPIPYQKAMEDGFQKIVLILTRQEGYRKKASKAMQAVYPRYYKKYPQLVKALLQMEEHYNRIQEDISALEREGRLFVIRPEAPVSVSRIEKDTEKLEDLYTAGRRVAFRRMNALQDYLKE
ncbi:patatin-like phospholipase family protein [Hominifimenecus sp. rT4P-3]|uniref:patatin-like phospholipase family protein n=1 Tax=Hominifimenecus sp. rT4P-3 TaxID=3242979 RepID=UPI003DA1FF38